MGRRKFMQAVVGVGVGNIVASFATAEDDDADMESEDIKERIRTLMAKRNIGQAKRLLEGYDITNTVKSGGCQLKKGTVGTRDAYDHPSESNSTSSIDLMIAKKESKEDIFTAYMYFKIDSDQSDVVNEERTKDPFAITYEPRYWQANSQSRSNVEFSGSGEGAGSQAVGSERFVYDDYNRYGVRGKLDEPEQETTADHYYHGCISTDIQSVGDDLDDKMHNVNAEYVHTWSSTDIPTWLNVDLGPAGLNVSNIGGGSWRMETTDRA